MKTQSVEELSNNSMREYAEYVTKSRILPSLCLKPVHKRIIWSLIKLNARHNKGRFIKTSTVAGKTLGYHPHGTMSVEAAISTLVNSPNALVEGRGSWGCFRGNTKISLLDGTEVPIKDLVNREEFWVYSCKPDGTIVPGRGHSARITKTVTELCRVTLDNGEVIECTPDHRFMMRDGSYKEAQHLTKNESLMPMYTRVKTDSGPHQHRPHLLNNKDMTWHPIHRYIASLLNEIPKSHVVHHKDRNTFNNNPGNLQIMSVKEHEIEHREDKSFRLKMLRKDENFNAKCYSVCNSGESKRRAVSERIKRDWDNGKFCHLSGLMKDKITKLVKSEEFISSLSTAMTEKVNKWNKDPDFQRRSKLGQCKKIIKDLEDNKLPISEINYNKSRLKVNPRAPSFNYYINNIHINHSVKSVIIFYLKESEPVYDITVDEYHNFALTSGVFVHNSYLGDAPAASRYTEIKTSELFESLLDDSMFDIGDFVPSYDNSDVEPEVIPTKLPLPLLIGQEGIGVGLVVNQSAIYIESLLEQVLCTVLGIEVVGDQQYAYECLYYNKSAIPEHKVVKRNGKEYLHITKLPIGGSLKILQSSQYIHELVSSGQIEIIDETTVDSVSVFIRAPQVLQQKILMSAGRRCASDMKFYWKRLRVSGYLDEWVKYRLSYIKKRTTKELSDSFNDNLIKFILSDLDSEDIPPGEMQNKISKSINHYYPESIPAEYQQFVYSKDKVKSIIIGKPISAIRQYEGVTDPRESKLTSITEQQCKDIMIAELESIHKTYEKLFSKPSKPMTKEPVYAKFEGQITKYIYYRPHGVIEVKFNKINRVMNWTAADDEVVLFRRDGTSSDLSPEFSGTINIDKDSEFIGFGIRSKPTALVSPSRIHVLTRTSSLKEPITSAFPSCKIEVDGKEIILRSGHNIDIPNGYKILGV